MRLEKYLEHTDESAQPVTRHTGSTFVIYDVGNCTGYRGLVEGFVRITLNDMVVGGVHSE